MLQTKVSIFGLEAGCDEAGRGCLAGPVTAAAVILPDHFYAEGLTDSKQIPETLRERLRPQIESEALAWAVAHVWPEEIDRINILNAAISAMHQALEQLSIQPEFIAVDGNRFIPFGFIPYSCQVKGDARFLHIAAASVLAKTHRDEEMLRQAALYPQYGWDRNKGYPTPFHRKAIREFGPSPLHRKSFKW